MTSIAERIAAAGIIVFEAEELTGRVPVPGGWDPGTRSFTVRLRNASNNQHLVTEWHIGSLSDSYPNKPDEVLDALASEAASYDNAGSFEGWASEFDYDLDSRKAEATWRRLGKSAEQLRVFLGDDYEAFLFDTERL